MPQEKYQETLRFSEPYLNSESQEVEAEVWLQLHYPKQEFTLFGSLDETQVHEAFHFKQVSRKMAAEQKAIAVAVEAAIDHAIAVFDTLPPLTN